MKEIDSLIEQKEAEYLEECGMNFEEDSDEDGAKQVQEKNLINNISIIGKNADKMQRKFTGLERFY